LIIAAVDIWVFVNEVRAQALRLSIALTGFASAEQTDHRDLAELPFPGG